MTGTWRDGIPLTFGETGYDQASTDFTNYAYPGNPNNLNEWSMFNSNTISCDWRAVGSTGFSNHINSNGVPGAKIQPGEILQFSLAFTVHSHPEFDHISMIDKMVDDDLRNLELAFNNEAAVNPYCVNYQVEEPEPEIEEPFISGIYPNPTSGEFTIAIEETDIEEVEIFNTAWQLIYSDKEISKGIKSININDFANGIYFLKIKLAGHIIFRKIVKD